MSPAGVRFTLAGLMSRCTIAGVRASAVSRPSSKAFAHAMTSSWAHGRGAAAGADPRGFRLSMYCMTRERIARRGEVVDHDRQCRMARPASLGLAFERVGGGARNFELLHRDGISQARIDGFVDRAHAAAADPAEHAIAIVEVGAGLLRRRMISAKWGGHGEAESARFRANDHCRRRRGRRRGRKPLFRASPDRDDARRASSRAWSLRRTATARRTPTASRASPRRSR